MEAGLIVFNGLSEQSAENRLCFKTDVDKVIRERKRESIKWTKFFYLHTLLATLVSIEVNLGFKVLPRPMFL